MVGSGQISGLLDWRIVLVVLFGGAATGIISIYFSGFILRWVGKPLGGRASSVEMRALLAWGMVPTILGLLLCVVTLAGLTFIGGLDRSGLMPKAASVLTLLMSGLSLWSWVITFLMLAQIQGFGLWRTAANFALGGLLFGVFILLPLVFRSFCFEPFNIPAKSMEPALLVGDYLFVSKYSYGYSRHSLPLSLHLFDGRILFHQPERGDLVVFKVPSDNRTDYIKRVIGLPGDRIQVTHRVLFINGKPVERRQIEDFAERDPRGGTQFYSQYIETLPNGHQHRILEYPGTVGPADNTAEYVVPDKHYFLLGDNRDNSQDSRYLKAVGYVPEENLIGRAAIIFYSADAASGVRIERLGLKLR
jgi:signal peptidase I